MTHRINGRASQAEERILKSTKYLLGDEETPKNKFKQLKALYDEHGWSAFDRDGKILFDNLNARFGKPLFDNDNAVHQTAFDIAPSSLAARDKANAAANFSSYRDDGDFDKEGARGFSLRPSPPYPSCMKKFVETNPLSDPETAARKLIEIANGVEAVQDGRIHIEKVNGPFLFEIKGTPAQYLAGLKHAIERGWIVMHESGTFIRFTQAGADLFA